MFWRGFMIRQKSFCGNRNFFDVCDYKTPVINNYYSLNLNNHDNHDRDGGASRGRDIQPRNLRSPMQISAGRPILKCAF